MKTTKQRLLSIAITMSVVINLALLAGLGYMTLVNQHVNQLCATMNLPVVVYINHAAETSAATTPVKSDLKPSAAVPVNAKI